MTNITVFHKKYCPYCRSAKKLLKAKGLSFKEIDVGRNAAEFAKMVKRSGRRTVPQIFIGNIHIGGFDDLKAQIANNSFPYEKIQAG